MGLSKLQVQISPRAFTFFPRAENKEATSHIRDRERTHEATRIKSNVAEQYLITNAPLMESGATTIRKSRQAAKHNRIKSTAGER
jgi:hypothetical protein